MALPQFGTNSARRRKRVYYEGTNTIYEGMAVCYNQDTTTNVLGYDKGNSTTGTTTAEGYQNEGKFMRVEDPASGNLPWFAGVVADCKMVGETGPGWIDVYVPNGAIVPVYTNASCTIGKVLGIASSSNILQADTGDGDPYPVALEMETVDRSGTSGLCLAKLGVVGVPVSGTNGYLAPVRSVSSGYAYGFQVAGDAVLRGTSASKSYVVQFSGDRESAYVATGDSNDAILKITGNNYAACDTNYILRGLNAAINNRSGGTAGRIEHSLGTQGKSGGTVGTILGLTITAENYGTVSDLFGGLDIVLKNEAAVATTEFGIRVRNENNSIAGDVATVLDVSETGANTGFTYFARFDAAATVSVVAASGDITFDTNDVLIPVKIGATTYYLVATDNA